MNATWRRRYHNNATSALVCADIIMTHVSMVADILYLLSPNSAGLKACSKADTMTKTLIRTAFTSR